jgi:adenylyltransferase/sulfurtransferase
VSHGDEPALGRYSRQVLFEPIGVTGQRCLLEARVTLIGCGALGSALADTLVRAGVGFLRIVDRDFITLDNLQRQVLFDEQDLAENLPKAEAARRKLARINSQVRVEAVVADVNHDNIERFAHGAHLLLDGTDNFETRFLINDLAVRDGIPWVYGGAVSATGMMMAVLPGETPCLRCVYAEPPPPEFTPTCDTVGVLASVAHLVAALQAIEALKILTGRKDEVNRHLVSIDAWRGRVVNLNVAKARDAGDCPCCNQRRFEWLDGTRASGNVIVCGRHAVQIVPATGGRVDLEHLAKRLGAAVAGAVTVNRFMLKADLGAHDLTVFSDGRAIIGGTDEPDEARTIYAKYVGA